MGSVDTKMGSVDTKKGSVDTRKDSMDTKNVWHIEFGGMETLKTMGSGI